jgi:hypothetical protein
MRRILSVLAALSLLGGSAALALVNGPSTLRANAAADAREAGQECCCVPCPGPCPFPCVTSCGE